MNEARRIRFNRTLFSVLMNGHAPIQMVVQLAAEDIELILDVRDHRDAARQFDRLCEEADIYYVHRPMEPGSAGGQADPSQDLASWAAGLSLRHRTCVIGDDDSYRLALSKKIAESAGQRLVDIESSPAPITLQKP